MGMASGGDERVRPERSNWCNWCSDCNAEFTGESDEWCKVYDISTGTEPPRYRKLSDIPKGVCIMCGSKNVQEPIKTHKTKNQKKRERKVRAKS